MADDKKVTAVKPATEQVVVEGKPFDQAKVDPALDFASSHLPYHTAATEKIAESNAKAAEKNKDKPYRYEINGYVVEEVEGTNPQPTDEADANTIWEVTSKDEGKFKQQFFNRRAAEIFAETHSPQFAKNVTAQNQSAAPNAPKT